jgi:hypothetical protein
MICGGFALFFGSLILESAQPVWIKVCLLFVFTVLTLAAMAAPYSCAVCRVTEQGIEVSESRCTDPGFSLDLAFAPIAFSVMVFEAMFLPSYRLIPWTSIESAKVEKKLFGQQLTLLAIDSEAKSQPYMVSWPLAGTNRFIKTVRKFAPLGCPIREVLASK